MCQSNNFPHKDKGNEITGGKVIPFLGEKRQKRADEKLGREKIESFSAHPTPRASVKRLVVLWEGGGLPAITDVKSNLCNFQGEKREQSYESSFKALCHRRKIDFQFPRFSK
jgi:hypothetical protein